MAADGKTIDWVLVRNRISMLGSRNANQVHATLERIGTRFGCRVADGIAERVIFRSLFASGMTVFDPLEEIALGGAPSMSHVSARQEYRNWWVRCNCRCGSGWRPRLLRPPDQQ
ncbi:division plane positioning ATPase MipZ [Devosia sp. A8/3-2]|nr:division plane positioning ATPase MipZ [Devosia sp. A8/3-2]